MTGNQSKGAKMKSDYFKRIFGPPEEHQKYFQCVEIKGPMAADFSSFSLRIIRLQGIPDAGQNDAEERAKTLVTNRIWEF